MTTMSKFYRPKKPVLKLQANKTNLGSSDSSSADSEDQEELDENIKSTDAPTENAKGKGIVANKKLPTRNQLLLVGLLEQLCVAYEKDQEKGQQLFKVLCTQLAGMKMINPIWVDDNWSSVRSQIKKHFNFLLNIAHAQVHKIRPALTDNVAIFMEPRLAGLHPVNITVSDQFNFHTSRYRDEFYELGVVGKGAYGKVFKAKNKMDSCVYAVKKIIFEDATEEMWFKILREMRHLAALSHPHIVRYCTAWLEQEPVTSPIPCTAGDSPRVHEVHSDSSHGAPEQGSGDGLSLRALTYPVRESSKAEIADASNKSETDLEIAEIMANASGLENSATNDVRISSDVTKDGVTSNSDTEDSIVFQETSRNDVKNGVTYGVINDVTDKVTHPDDAEDSVVFAEESQSSHVSVLPEFSNKPLPQMPPPAYYRMFRVVMYIQMELCETTLKDWISRRNDLIVVQCKETLKAAVVDPVPCLHIIKQVLHAVEHIHANGLMHRDLKPQNIFVNENKDIKAKVGDFGLSRQLYTGPPESPMTRKTSAHIPMTPHPGTSVTPPVVGTEGDEEENPFIWEMFTSGVGTTIYAAPEQLEGSQYNQKSDVYSLGLIMYELYEVFSTAMERVKCLGKARKGLLPDTFCEQWPIQSGYIKRMLATDPEDRPTVSELLQGELFRCKDEIIRDLNQELIAKDEKLKEKNEELKRKDEKISQLSREISEMRQELARLRLSAMSVHTS